MLTFAIGLYLQAFYLQVLKWPHLTNQFNFTQVKINKPNAIVLSRSDVDLLHAGLSMRVLHLRAQISSPVREATKADTFLVHHTAIGR